MLAFYEPEFAILPSAFGDITGFLEGILIDSLPLLHVVSFSPLFLKPFCHKRVNLVQASSMET